MAGIKLEITEKQNGKSLRDILRCDLKISSGLLTKLKKTNGIRVNDTTVNVTERVKTGDVLTIEFPKEKSENITPVNIPLDVLYEDEYLFIINKPKDMPTHPSIGNRDNTVANACMFYFKDKDFVFRPVNRLDRDTTGIVVIAKDARTSSILSKQMTDGLFKKTYCAILCGIPKEEKGIIDAPIGRADNSIIKREVRPDGQAAITEYEIIKTCENKSLARIKLHTGRTHQIRVHFAHIGTPLLYDYMYGTEIPGETLYLHCGCVEFIHPADNTPLKIEVSPNFTIFTV